MLKEIINKFYRDKSNDRSQHHFYISQAGKCPRQVFFKFKNAPKKELEPNILRLFDHGDHIHQLIMRSLLSTRDIHIVAAEVDIPPQEMISGRADAIVSDGKELYVLDIKSINSFSFRKLKEPKKDHINQIQLYLHYFRIEKGILLYVNKNTQQLKELVVNYDIGKSERLLSSFSKLEEQINKDLVPARITSYPNDWQCKYCDFRNICDMGDKDQMRWLDFKKRIESYE